MPTSFSPNPISATELDQTPLMQAASSGNVEQIHTLLAAGADPNIISKEGDTALILAAGATRWVILDPEETAFGIVRQTPEGLAQLRPLPAASILPMVTALLEAGANPNLQNCSATPLMEAARYGQLEAIHLLLEAGADPNGAASDGETALDIAKLYRQTEAIACLEAALT